MKKIKMKRKNSLIRKLHAKNRYKQVKSIYREDRVETK